MDTYPLSCLVNNQAHLVNNLALNTCLLGIRVHNLSEQIGILYSSIVSQACDRHCSGNLTFLCPAVRDSNINLEIALVKMFVL